MAALRSRSSRAGPVRQLRLFVARRPVVHWLLIGLAGMLTGVFVYSRAAGAEDARQRWGTARPVIVAVRDLPAGHRLEPGDVRRQSWPAALLPSGALSSLDGPVVVAAPVVAGEPVVRSRLGRARAGPVAAALTPGRRAVTLPVGDAPPPVAVGDQVDLVAAGSALAAQVVARGATVMAVREGAVVVAVSTDELPAVAGGLVDGTVVVAVSGDPPSGP
jgi:Flp pilus assembly protein CpaB